MSKQDEAIAIIKALGMPRAQQNERSALTLLALAGIGPRTLWAKTSRRSLRIWDIMAFMRQKYGKNYAANSRETIRRQTIHQFEQARIADRNADDPSRPTNSGNNCYSLTDDAVSVLRAHGTPEFEHAVESFARRFGQLSTAYNRRRELKAVRLRLPEGVMIALSPGEHNALQWSVVEELGSRFAPGATLLYLGDTAKKHVVCASDQLKQLGIAITQHDKLPDVVLYDATKRWLFLIEAVTSHGPVSPKRHAELEAMFNSSTAARVYITAFLDKPSFRKHAAEIAWETEVWVAESPDHMIHFNGPKFLGPYSK